MHETGNGMVTIYTYANCESCRHAISFAKFRNIKHEVVQLDSQQKVDALHKRIGIRNIFTPLIVDENNKVIGHLKEFKAWNGYNINK